MKHLKKVLDKQELSELNGVRPVKITEKVEPTEAHIKLVLTALKKGVSQKIIRREIKSKEGHELTYEQVKEIAFAREARIIELTPKKKEK